MLLHRITTSLAGPVSEIISHSFYMFSSVESTSIPCTGSTGHYQ